MWLFYVLQDLMLWNRDLKDAVDARHDEDIHPLIQWPRASDKDTQLKDSQPTTVKCPSVKCSQIERNTIKYELRCFIQNASSLELDVILNIIYDVSIFNFNDQTYFIVEFQM